MFSLCREEHVRVGRKNANSSFTETMCTLIRLTSHGHQEEAPLLVFETTGEGYPGTRARFLLAMLIENAANAQEDLLPAR